MSKEKRIPYFRFYTTDWRGDIPLRMCSYAARGLWIDLLTLMHESDRPGHLLIAGQPPSPRQLASLLGGSEKEIRKLLAELEHAGIFSLDPETGAVFSRRMVRDKAKEERDRENGRGGGNPKLKGQDNQPGKPSRISPDANQGVNPQAKAHGYTSSSLREDLPSTSVPGSASPSASDQGGGVDEATAIIAEFDQSRATVYGEAQARPWPAPSDLVVAQRLVEQGATPALCRHVFDSRNAKLKAEGHKPRATLKAFEPDVVEALNDRPKPNGQGAAPGKPKRTIFDLPDGAFAHDVFGRMARKGYGQQTVELRDRFFADPAAALPEIRRIDAEMRGVTNRDADASA
ncbi:hypothetical protein [Inquilinus sp.]|uniref:hypothetical protein n=1 Tax=Inquilinus sp. TaxID=1932117 RepID=UPI0031D344E1